MTQRGPDNISAIINAGVESVRGPYTHYLVLGSDIKAIEPGWLEHMLGYGQRADVGVVGALLLDGSERVQHAGVVIGMNGLADTAFRNASYRGWLSGRNPGQDGCLLASRDVSAVSAACMLTRADVFHRLDGFDEHFATALHDVDYCLRAGRWDTRRFSMPTPFCRHAASENRATLDVVSLPEEAAFFRDRYQSLMIEGDPFFSPSLSRFSTAAGWNPLIVPGLKPKVRTVRVVLPSAVRTCQDHRRQAHHPDEISNRPHFNGRPAVNHRRLLS